LKLNDREIAILTLNAWEGFSARTLIGWDSKGLSPEIVLKGNDALWEEAGLPGKCRMLLDRSREGSWGRREADKAFSMGVRLVIWGNGDYPGKLLDLPRPPAVLYAKGSWPPVPRTDAVVGTRRCSPYGARVGREVATRLAESGYCVLSGGALGIDGAAHTGALEAGGKTMAILGTGIDVTYPLGHEKLFSRIAEEGTLVSEFPLSTEARPWRFPRRNRIISALADRLVVVEAPSKSGAIVTARLAMEIGREVWVVPGRIDEWVCKGSNALLWDGAHPLVEIEDLVRFDGTLQGTLFKEEGPGGNSSRILQALRLFGDQTVDILASQVKMGAADILVELSRMEAFGLVRRSGPGRWSAGKS